MVIYASSSDYFASEIVQIFSESFRTKLFFRKRWLQFVLWVGLILKQAQCSCVICRFSLDNRHAINCCFLYMKRPKILFIQEFIYYYYYDLFVEHIKLVQILDYWLYMTIIQFIHKLWTNNFNFSLMSSSSHTCESRNQIDLHLMQTNSGHTLQGFL